MITASRPDHKALYCLVVEAGSRAGSVRYTSSNHFRSGDHGLSPGPKLYGEMVIWYRRAGFSTNVFLVMFKHAARITASRGRPS